MLPANDPVANKPKSDKIKETVAKQTIAKSKIFKILKLAILFLKVVVESFEIAENAIAEIINPINSIIILIEQTVTKINIRVFEYSFSADVSVGITLTQFMIIARFVAIPIKK